ncbi:hypothetical protein UP17_23925 [Peribacillus simplex]|nr:hypothetical protein UP17_23925 [Peribacillus simplex]
MKDNEPYIQNVKREFCERNMVAIIIEAFTNNEKETRDLNSWSWYHSAAVTSSWPLWTMN